MIFKAEGVLEMKNSPDKIMKTKKKTIMQEYGIAMRILLMKVQLRNYNWMIKMMK
jgi:hypothetical protein